MFQFSCHLIYSNPLTVACVFYKHKRNGMQQQQVHMLAKTVIANHVKLGGRGGGGTTTFCVSLILGINKR